MSILSLIQGAFRRLRENPMMIVPILASTILIGLLSLVLIGSLVPRMTPMHEEMSFTSEQAMGFAGAALGRAVPLMVISMILVLLGHGMTVVMADSAISESPVKLKDAWEATANRIVPLVIAAFLVGILVSLGMVLLVLPGIVIALFLMFTFVVVMLDDRNAFQAIGDSFRIVRQNFGTVFVFFLVLIALAVLVFVVNFVLNWIPVVGAILSLLVSSVYATFVSVFVVQVYREISLNGGTAPEAEV